MAYKRELWKSGLTYKQSCPICKTTVIYQDDRLGYRPWFPDGFIYCPTCQKPLRHNENYSTTARDHNVTVDYTGNPQKSASSSSLPAFCAGCGRPFAEGDNFCCQCGKKRI